MNNWTTDRIVRWGIITIVLLCLLWLLWFVFTHGGTEISTSNTNAEISILKNDKSEEILASGKQSVFKILPIGTYIVSVKDNNHIQRSEVSVSRFTLTKKQLKTSKNLSVSPVTNMQATSFNLNERTLGLLDTDSGKLSYIDKNDSYTFTDDAFMFENAVYKNATEGYALGVEAETQQKSLVRFNGTAIQKIVTPTPITQSTYLSYNISRNGDLYVIEDGALYRYQNNTFQKLTEVNKENFILSLTDQFITMLYRDKEENCELQIYSFTTKSTKKIPLNCVQSPDYITSAQWSPDNSKLLVSAGGFTDVYDTNYTKLYSVPDTQSSNGIWDSNDTIVYASKNFLWRYNLTTKISSTIAATPDYITVLNLTKSSDEYLFTGRADSTLTLYRTSQSEPSLNVQKLSESNMHTLSDGCRIRYTNLSSTKIIAATSESSKGECGLLIQSYLSSITINAAIPVQFLLSEEAAYTD